MEGGLIFLYPVWRTRTDKYGACFVTAREQTSLAQTTIGSYSRRLVNELQVLAGAQPNRTSAALIFQEDSPANPCSAQSEHVSLLPSRSLATSAAADFVAFRKCSCQLALIVEVVSSFSRGSPHEEALKKKLLPIVSVSMWKKSVSSTCHRVLRA